MAEKVLGHRGGVGGASVRAPGAGGRLTTGADASAGGRFRSMPDHFSRWITL